MQHETGTKEKEEEKATLQYQEFNTFLEAMNGIYDGTERNQPVLDYIKDTSGQGATPIPSFTIAGHGSLPAMLSGLCVPKTSSLLI